MTTQLVFRNTSFNPLSRENKIWLTATELACALEYKSEDAVSRIYRRNEDEFIPCMSQTVNLTASGNYQKTVRIFSLRGAHLIAMFARTPVAKEFRKWVLDILDRETHQTKTPDIPPVCPENVHEPMRYCHMQQLTRLVWLMTRDFHHRQPFINAVWFALRESTGTPSPQRFQVRHLPIIASECERIWRITSALQNTMLSAEETVMKRLVRNREDEQSIMADIQRELRELQHDTSETLSDIFGKWKQDEIKKLLIN